MTLIANVTDIDDKILAKGGGRASLERRLPYERAFHDAYGALGCRRRRTNRGPPVTSPRCSS